MPDADVSDAKIRPVIEHGRLPPGPPERPVVGQLFRLLRDPIGLAHEAATYGDIATLSKKPVLLYLVSHPDLVQQLLVTHYRMLRRPPNLEALRMIVGNGLATAEEPTHLRNRRLIQPQFHRRRIEGYGRTMVDYALTHDERWQRLPSGSRVDMALEMQDLIRRVVTKTLFGLDLEEDARRLSEACERAASFIRRTNFHMRRLRRLVHRLPLPMTRRFRRDIAYIDGVVNGLIEARRAAREEHDDLLGMLLGLRYVDEAGNDAGAMSDRQVRDEAMTMFSAGQGTTTMGLAWTWYLLATHPEIQTRFHREVDDVLQGRPPGPADLQNLPLTDRIVTESMRLYPPVYMTLQLVAESFELGGYRIREGALVSAPPDRGAPRRAVVRGSAGVPAGPLDAGVPQVPASLRLLPLRGGSPHVHRRSVRRNGHPADRRVSGPALDGAARPRAQGRTAAPDLAQGQGWPAAVPRATQPVK